MKILAIETASIPGSIALLEDGDVICRQRMNAAQKTTEAITVVIQSLITQQSWDMSDVQMVSTTTGPGSFTGLRIGVTLCKVFAYATGAQAFGLNTLEVIARQADVVGEVTACIDAQRGDLFAATFACDPNAADSVQVRHPTQVIDVSSWLASLPENAIVTGSGLSKVGDRLPEHVRAIDAANWKPRASTLGQLASQRFSAGERQDFWRLAPSYFRKSAAEEKADATK